MTTTIKRTKSPKGITLSAGVEKKPAPTKHTTTKKVVTKKPAARATLTTSAWAQELGRDPKTVRALIRRQVKRGVTTWTELMLPADDGKTLSHTFPDNKTTRSKLKQLIDSAA